MQRSPASTVLVHPLCHLAPGTLTPSSHCVCCVASHRRRAEEAKTLPDMCHRWQVAMAWVSTSDALLALQVVFLALTVCHSAHGSIVIAGQEDTTAGQLVAPTKPDLVEMPAGAGRGERASLLFYKFIYIFFQHQELISAQDGWSQGGAPLGAQCA